MKRIYRYLKRIVLSIIDNDFFGMAAEMGFMLVIGIFPFMLVLMAAFGWLGKKAYIAPILTTLGNFVPEQALGLIQQVLNEVMVFQRGGTMAIVGICVTLFLSSNGVAVILKGLNRAYKVEETRSLLYTRILSLIMVFVNILVLFLSINLIVFGKVIVEFLVNIVGLGKGYALTIMIVRWPIAFLALWILAFLSYYILPDLKGEEKLKRKSAIPGTLFFTIAWLVGSWGFSIYVNNLGTYNIVYGAIGAFAILMVWLYYTSMLMLIGGEVNSQVYNKLEERLENERQ